MSPWNPQLLSDEKENDEAASRNRRGVEKAKR